MAVWSFIREAEEGRGEQVLILMMQGEILVGKPLSPALSPLSRGAREKGSAASLAMVRFKELRAQPARRQPTGSGGFARRTFSAALAASLSASFLLLPRPRASSLPS